MCHRKDTLRLAGGEEWKRREWLREKCGCVATDGGLDRLWRPAAMERPSWPCHAGRKVYVI